MKKLRILPPVLALLLCVLMFAACNNDTTHEEKQNIDVNNSEVEADPDEKEIPEPQKETVVLKLYFPDNEALYLHLEEREVELYPDDSREMAVLNELFYGPENEELSPSLSGEDLINSVYTDENGLCTVDLKQDFVILNTGGTTRESFAIGSIVHSLCELDGIERVKINIDENINAEFGHSTLESEFIPRSELVASLSD